ncbi:MAG: hypothetical protein ACOY4R_27705 [Pseudomonadota bacterium]
MAGYFSRTPYRPDAYEGSPDSRENVADDLSLYQSMYFADGGEVPDYAGGGIVKRIANAIRAWHGSPHDFDRFDASKIGTGEGAQAYGHGLYFAENPNVARSYRDDITSRQVSRRGQYDPRNIADHILRRSDGDWEHAADLARRLKESPADAKFFLGMPNSAPKDSTWDSVADLLARRDVPALQGRLYEVNIHEDPARFLDWDKPVMEQAPHIRSAVSEYADSTVRGDVEPLPGPNPWQHIADRMWKEIKGADIYRDIALSDGNPALGAAFMPRYASDYLRDVGIPGVRYLDQGSRRAGEGTYNYVVFPGMEDIVEIVGKYAEGGAVQQQPAEEGDILHTILGTVGGLLGNLIPIPGLGSSIGKFAGHSLSNLITGKTGDIDDDLARDFVPGLGSVFGAPAAPAVTGSGFTFAEGGRVNDATRDPLLMLEAYPEIRALLDQQFADQIMDEDLAAAALALAQTERPPPTMESGNPFFPRAAQEVRFAEGGVFDPEGDGYDYAGARAAGLMPEMADDGRPHWPSRDPRSGMMLKGRRHRTYPLALEADRAMGLDEFKGSDGRYYTAPVNRGYFWGSR